MLVVGPRIDVLALGVVLVFAFLAVPTLRVALGRLLLLGLGCFCDETTVC